MNWAAYLGLGLLGAAGWAPYAWSRLRRSLHILQLEEYENGRTLRWAARHWASEQTRVAAAATLFLLVFPVVDAARASSRTAATALILLIGGALVSWLNWRPPAVKKPLQVTERVKRLIVALSGALVLLAALMLLAGWALRLPGRWAFVVWPVLAWLAIALGPLLAAFANLLAQPQENAIKRRFRREAEARIRQVNPKIVAITGSYGKTTTKELVTSVLESKYRVLRTPRSFNTPMGVTRAIREDLKDDTEVFVVEMGAYKQGDIRDLCRLVGGPHVSAIVGINEQHLERMGSIERTIATKYEICEETRPGGVTVFNIDNASCAALADKTNHVRVVRVGSAGHEPRPDLWADNVTVTPKLMKFDVHDGDQVQTVRTRLIGRHLVPNILIALAMGKELGVDLRSAVSRVGRAEPVAHRLNVSETDGMIVIDDAYSTNVDGARAALDLLAELPAERRFLVTPGIVELGKMEEVRNVELGAHAARVCDYLIAVGVTPGQYVKAGALSLGCAGHVQTPCDDGSEAPQNGVMAADRIISCANLAEAQAFLRDHMQRGDAVLFLNDLPDNYA